MTKKQDLEDLKAKLDAFEGKKPTDEKPESSMGVLLNVGIELISGVLVGIGVGLLIDWAFSTKPWGLIAFFVLGSGAGMLNVYRALTKKQK
ncbi:Putative F0F1-ATPase subunit Ca2+/Mg2+ transporter [Candidatus Bealeia paramacronuclearis]|uniref:F0F1-ATPase subunit Ca2+/Mg2+ transporter n=1 Tax=Candidatus Bealeia paramacronuclearis TaxID=1921001 RepID=A0ABZ2C9M9_9PROT|nr:putative F0F1-ATPase subunit Ca2+/Mg2+ transporter [Candidatus Bealeia paramacronuclearis]